MESAVCSRQYRPHGSRWSLAILVLALVRADSAHSKFRRARCRRSAGPPKAATRFRCSTSTPTSSASGRSSGRCRKRRSARPDRLPGTTTVAKVDGRFYEAVSEGEGPAGPFKVRELIAYHRENKTLARTVTDSRGLQLFAVWSGGRRPGRDLQHPLRERTVHRQRQVGAPASHAALAVAAQLSNGDGDLGGWRSRSRIWGRRGGESSRDAISDGLQIADF